MTAVALDELLIADGISLPIDFVTKTCAILAQRRKGKTYTGAVIAEELVRLKQPWTAMDPTGAWWGLRASADGLKAGLPVVVLGGIHGDLPLEAGSGAFVADLVLDNPGWYVLDLSLLGSRPAEREFATAFGDRLLRRKMQAGMDFPMHLFVDEADMFVPQEKESKGDVDLLAAYQGIVRRGGLHGLGSTIISQRPALVNKSVLTQLDLLILLRLVGGQDQDAVDRDYLKRHASKEQREDVMGSLATLKIGEAWLYEPGADPDPILVRVHIRQRRTFNSSSTPKVGEVRVEPKVLAAVDIANLAVRMQAAIERVKEDDPKELKKLVADLRRQLSARPDVVADPVEVERIVEVSVLTDQDRAKIALIMEAIETGQAGVVATYQGLRDVMAKVVESAVVDRPKPRVVEVVASIPRAPTRVALPRPVPASRTDDDLSPSAQKVVDAFMWYEAFSILQPSRTQVGLVAGYRQGGRFNNLLAELRGKGLVEYGSGKTLILTDAGRALANGAGLPLTIEALHSAVLEKLPPSEGRVLEPLLSCYPNPMSRDDLAVTTDYARGGRFNNIVSALKGLGLVEYVAPSSVVAADALFPSRS